MAKFITLFIAFVVAAVMFFPVTTSALDGQAVSYVLNASDGIHLTDTKWCSTTNKSWVTAVKTCASGAGSLSYFNQQTSSYVLFKKVELSPQLTNPSYTTTNGQPQYLKTNRYKLYVASENKKLSFYKNADNQYYVTSTDTINQFDITAEPNSDPDYKYNWTGGFSSGQYTVTANTSINPNVAGYKGIVIGNDVYEGQVGAVNVDYASSWNVGKFTNWVPVGEEGTPGCGTLDIGCWIGSLTRGFTQGVKEMFGLMIDAFVWLWVPDGTKIKASFDSMATTLGDRLGFLSYPFTFLASFWGAYNSSSNWCNSTTCVKSLGTVFGTNFTINFGAMQQETPTVWTFLTLAARGLAVVTLMFALRAKWVEVTTK